MKKFVFILVVLVFVTSTFAVAADQKVAAKIPVQMTDAEMSQVVGGKKTPPGNYYINLAIHELIHLTYELPLSKYEQSLLRSKLECLNNLFSRGFKYKLPPATDI